MNFTVTVTPELLRGLAAATSENRLMLDVPEDLAQLEGGILAELWCHRDRDRDAPPTGEATDGWGSKPEPAKEAAPREIVVVDFSCGCRRLFYLDELPLCRCSTHLAAVVTGQGNLISTQKGSNEQQR